MEGPEEILGRARLECCDAELAGEAIAGYGRLILGNALAYLGETYRVSDGFWRQTEGSMTAAAVGDE